LTSQIRPIKVNKQSGPPKSNGNPLKDKGKNGSKRVRSAQLSLGDLGSEADAGKRARPGKATPGKAAKTVKAKKDKAEPEPELLLAPEPQPEPSPEPMPAASPEPAAAPDPAARPVRPRRNTAESMAAKQREISVSEFFTKNRHLLGFDNPGKALLTTVKEAVDNSLDACEEAGILPSIRVEIHEIAEDRFRVVVEDNGPGIIKAQIPKIFGKLLYGSKFHRLKQSRGQQGIGISAAGMYGQLTTGKPAVITSKTQPHRPAIQCAIVLNTRKNAPEIVSEKELEWQVEHGTRVEIELQGTYKAGRRSVDEYLEQVAIANPHAELIYAPPKGRPPLHLPRATDELPPDPTEIKPHPYGVELGMLMKLLRESKSRTISGALQQDFSRVTGKVAQDICQAASVGPNTNPSKLALADLERLYKAIPSVKIMAPQTACVVPIGEELIRKGLEREINADIYVSSTRPPAVYRGNPFRVEVGLAYGGALRSAVELETDELLDVRAEDKAQGPISLIRFANRVPLQYQQSACAIFKGVVEQNWKQYGLPQPRGGLPLGPMVLIVHLASVWVPFTSESKEAIAHYPDIIKEIKLALKDVGRKLSVFLRSKERARLEARRKSIFEMYIGELVASLHNLTGTSAKTLHQHLYKMATEHTGGEEAAAAAGVESTGERIWVEDNGEGEVMNGDGNGGVPKKKGAGRKAKSRRPVADEGAAEA
jgi:DNA topoisomerase VI subunit B